MATIGSIVVQILANAALLKHGLDSAKKDIDRFTGQLGKKIVSVGTGVALVNASLNATREGLRACFLEGEKFEDAMAKALETNLKAIPILGSIGELIGLAAAEQSGYARRLRETNEEIERVQQKEKAWTDAIRSRQRAQEDFNVVMAETSAQAAAIQQQQAVSRAQAEMEAKFGPGDSMNKQRAMAFAGAAADARPIMEIIRSLNDQVEVLKRGEDGWLRYKLELLGATDASMKMFEQAIAQRDALAAEQAAQKALQEALSQTRQRLQEQIDTFGMTAEAIERYRLAKLGATAADLKAISAMQEQLEAMNRQKTLMEKGKQIFEQTRTPIERYRQTIAELKEMLEAQAISMDTYLRAVKQAKEEFNRGNQVETPAAREVRFAESLAPVGGRFGGSQVGQQLEFQKKEVTLSEQQLAVLYRVEDLIDTRLDFTKI